MTRRLTITLAAAVLGVLGSSGVAAAKANTFVGTCVLNGTTTSGSPERGDYKGTCTGSLDGRSSKTHDVRTKTLGSGPSAGPVPLTREGTGVTKFVDKRRRSIDFTFTTLLTTLQVEGDDGGGGSGTAAPQSDGSVTLELDFSDGISG